MERHGEEPRIVKCDSSDQELETIRSLVGEFLQSERQSLGVVCKTRAEANDLFQKIRHFSDRIYFVDFESEQFHDGIVVTFAHMAKGLEFDQAIVPFVNESNYRTDLDKSLLYIACTRAMHKLELTHTGEITPFLRF